MIRTAEAAALWYLYEGPKKQGRGRPIKYAGKVLLKEPHFQYFTLVQDTSTHTAYQAVVFSKSLKVKLKVLLVHNLKADGSIKNCKVFACTDTTLANSKVWQYLNYVFNCTGRPDLRDKFIIDPGLCQKTTAAAV